MVLGKIVKLFVAMKELEQAPTFAFEAFGVLGCLLEPLENMMDILNLFPDIGGITHIGLSENIIDLSIIAL